MLMIRRGALAIILLLAATPLAAFGQQPLRERVHFTISAPYQLRKSDVVFPAGKYIISQISDSDPDLFALYKDNTRHSPLALIRTIPAQYPYSNKTKIVMDTNEPRPDAFPVVEGWTVPGMDSLEVSGVVASKHVSSKT